MNECLKIVGRITGRILKWLIYLLTIITIAITAYVVVTIHLSEDEERWTYKAFTVLSDSMQDTFQAGDVVIIENIEAESLEVGDIISFYSIDPYTEGEVYTHKIREITTYNGELAFTTYGTTTGDSDLYPALASNVIGELKFVVHDVGTYVEYIKSQNGYIFIIFIPMLVIILLEIKNLIYIISQRKKVEEDEDDIQILYFTYTDDESAEVYYEDEEDEEDGDIEILYFTYTEDEDIEIISFTEDEVQISKKRKRKREKEGER